MSGVTHQAQEASTAENQPRSKPAMQGWLNKQSHGVIKKSQRHWFELWGPELRYFASEADAVATRVIMVNGCRVVDAKAPASLVLDTPSDPLAKQYVFACDDPSELSRWKQALTDASALPPLVKPLLPAQERVQMVALVNSKSGGKQGPGLKAVLVKHLGPNSVFDLANGGPKAGIQEHLRDGPNTRFLVCGGVTVGWTLQDVDALKRSGVLEPERPIPVAVLPLGTGN
eukprot:CAMPEP_0172161632 /NCGR_PEP_ID=MMETSP1050-20130122/6231_1 /TAXON_ID=233186 /ORGANISM="Cryptomonas curvata, Strain CCAP979/52" /LENGTH=228 /DNA_ID=CAMNT_0012831547 /DNA_START=132 /DNA_END=815 /DNA_ORIENTATION=+